MKAFEITTNGKHRCVAGVGVSGVLDVIVAWAGRPEKKPDDARLTVGGLKDGKHLRWINQEALKVGDEIVIRVVDADTADEPISRGK